MTQRKLLREIQKWSAFKLHRRFLVAAVQGDFHTLLICYQSARHLDLSQVTLESYPRPLEVHALTLAAQNGKSLTTRLLIEQGVEIHGEYEDHFSPCSPSFVFGWDTQSRWKYPVCASAESAPSARTLRLLLANGADANAPPSLNAGSPLECAIRSGDCGRVPYQAVVAKVEVLLQHGADPRVKGVGLGGHGRLPLHCAAERGYVEVAEKLLAHGANVDARQDGFTALMRSSMAHQPDTTRLLLRAGADIDARLPGVDCGPLALAELGDHDPKPPYMKLATLDILLRFALGLDVDFGPIVAYKETSRTTERQYD